VRLEDELDERLDFVLSVIDQVQQNRTWWRRWLSNFGWFLAGIARWKE
jgi:hypothetical protein